MGPRIRPPHFLSLSRPLEQRGSSLFSTTKETLLAFEALIQTVIILSIVRRIPISDYCSIFQSQSPSKLIQSQTKCGRLHALRPSSLYIHRFLSSLPPTAVLSTLLATSSKIAASFVKASSLALILFLLSISAWTARWACWTS
jgi:hypothetical protein